MRVVVVADAEVIAFAIVVVVAAVANVYNVAAEGLRGGC